MVECVIVGNLPHPNRSQGNFLAYMDTVILLLFNVLASYGKSTRQGPATDIAWTFKCLSIAFTQPPSLYRPMNPYLQLVGPQAKCVTFMV